MNDQPKLFTDEEMLRFQMKRKQYLIAAVLCPLIIFVTAFLAVVLAGLGYIEYEIVFRIFDYLDGGYDYWSPEIMGLTAAIMIVGYHVMAEKFPNNISVMIVEFIVRILIPVYLVGAGLYIAKILFDGGLAVNSGGLPPVIGGIPEMGANGNWLDWFFANITNPLGVALFSLGIGGLAVVNIFVAHSLLKSITRNITAVLTRLNSAKHAVQAYKDIKHAQREYARVFLDAGDLSLKSESYLIREIAAEVLGVIADALLPHKIWLKEHEYNKAKSFEPEDPADPKQVAKDVAKIEAITEADIIAAIQPKYLEKLP